MAAEAQGGIEVLEADLVELENSIAHLVRSNDELAQVEYPHKHIGMLRYRYSSLATYSSHGCEYEQRV